MLAPICEKSGNKANKFCVNTQCNHSAWICKYCEDDYCEHLHLHNGKLQCMYWSQISPLVANIPELKQGKHLPQSLKEDIVSKLQNLIGELRKTLNSFIMQIEKYDKGLKFGMQFQNVLEKINAKKFHDISGQQMSKFNAQLKNIYTKDDAQIQKLKKEQAQQYENLLYRIRECIQQYYKKQLICSLTNQQKESLKKYNLDIEKKPGDFKCFYDRGGYLYRIKQYELAQKDFNKSLQLNPKYSNSYWYLGSIYLTLNQYQISEQNFNKAIQHNPKNHTAYASRGWLYYNKHEYEKALIDYNKSLEFDSTQSLAYNNRGLIYEIYQNYEAALKDFTKSIELDNVTEYSYKNRAKIYRKLNMIKQAEEDEKKHKEIKKLKK